MELPLPGEAGSRKREVFLVGGAVVLVGALVYYWHKRQPTDEGTSSVAGDLGAAGYTYPMPGGGINTAPGDTSDYNSLFRQNEEILRLLQPGAATGATTGTPDPGKPAPSPQYVDPVTGWYQLAPDASYQQRSDALNEWLAWQSSHPGQAVQYPADYTPIQSTPTYVAPPPSSQTEQSPPAPVADVTPAPVATAVPTMTDQLRWSGTIDAASRQTLASGGQVTRGNGYVYQMSGPNGTGVPVRVA